MRKIFVLLFALLYTCLLPAQTTPKVAFSFAIQPGTTTVHFSNTSQSLGDGVKKAFWKFGDGTFASTGPLEGAIHNYAKPGTYEACLRIFRYANAHDSVLIGSECRLVVIESPLHNDSCAVEFAFRSATATSPGGKFIAKPWHNQAKKPVRICWKFGDGRDTCIQYSASYTGDYWIEHVYPKAGRYEACVVVKYDGGCESRKCGLVNIEHTTPPATCEVSINEVAGHIASLERRFYAGLQPAKTAEKICWTFGDGADTCILLSSPLNPQQLLVSHRYAAPGAYRVCVRVVYAGGCVAERCKAVEIHLPNSGICGGYFTDSAVTDNTIHFAATSIHKPGDQVTGYLWTFGDGTSANGQQATHEYAQPGKYAVCLSMHTESGCETKICKPMMIAGNVKPQLVLAPNPVANTLTAVFHSLIQQTITIRIYNNSGVLIKSFSRNAVAGNNTWSFDVSSLQSGVYSVIVQSSNQFATAIFFKQ